MIGKAFAAGVEAALKFFQKPATRESLAKSAELVLKTMQKAAREAAKAAARARR